MAADDDDCFVLQADDTSRTTGALECFGATSFAGRWQEFGEEAEHHGSRGHVAGRGLHHVDGRLQGRRAHACIMKTIGDRAGAQNRISLDFSEKNYEFKKVLCSSGVPAALAPPLLNSSFSCSFQGIFY